MTQYIDKAAVVAEINRRIMDAPIDCYGHQRVWAYNDIKDILDTLEVEEVDLEEELRNYIKHYRDRETGYSMFGIAKHFFELGLKERKDSKL